MVFKEIESMHSSMKEKRERSRRQILNASLELFYENGFQKTTTRDIIKKTGILNGSLYNRFKSKEEILICIVTEALEYTLKECEIILKEENNPLIAAVFPGALEITLSCRYPKAADLLYEVHRLWGAVEQYTRINVEWFTRYLENYGIKFAETEGADLKMLTFLGAIGNLCGYYAHGGKSGDDDILHHMVTYMATMLSIPLLDLNKTVESLYNILEGRGLDLFMEKICPQG